MIVKLLNGELLEVEFDKPQQTIWDICKRIWDFQKIEFKKGEDEKEKKEEQKNNKYFNHFVFENEEGKTITINEFHPYFDCNSDDLFVDNSRLFHRKNGIDRIIDTSVFSRCHALFLRKKEKILVYCVGKNKFRCINVNDFSFHVDASNVAVVNPADPWFWNGTGVKAVKNNQICFIDYESILSHYPNSFKAGSRVFEDTGSKIECYLTKIIRNFVPSYLSQDGSRRESYSHKKLIEYTE